MNKNTVLAAINIKEHAKCTDKNACNSVIVKGIPGVPVPPL